MARHAIFFALCVLGLVAAALPQFATAATASDDELMSRIQNSDFFDGQAPVDSLRPTNAGVDSKGTDDHLTTSMDKASVESQLPRREPLETEPDEQEEVHFRKRGVGSDAEVTDDHIYEEHTDRKVVPRMSEGKRSFKDLLKKLALPAVGMGASYFAADRIMPELTEQQQAGDEPLTTGQNVNTVLGFAALAAAVAFLGLGIKRTYRHFSPRKNRSRQPAPEHEVPESGEDREDARHVPNAPERQTDTEE
uniref:Dense granule antigen n=1 Tax=Toxoplasma gondii TaxID=5811 RepID=I7BFN7_TOXGO|nr:dense granule antigen [Toxoplasma gondii]